MPFKLLQKKIIFASMEKEKILFNIDYLDIALTGDFRPTLDANLELKKGNEKIIIAPHYNIDKRQKDKFVLSVGVFDVFMTLTDKVYFGNSTDKYFLAGTLVQNKAYKDEFNFKVNNILLYELRFIEARGLWDMLRVNFNVANLTIKHITRIDICADFREDSAILLDKFTPVEFIKQKIRDNIRRVNTGAWRAKETANIDYHLKNGVPTGFYFNGTNPRPQLYNKTLEMQQVKFKNYIFDSWINAGLLKSETDNTNIWRLEFRYTHKNNELFTARIFDYLDNNGNFRLFDVRQMQFFISLFAEDIEKRFKFALVNQNRKKMKTNAKQIVNISKQFVIGCNSSICYLTNYKLSAKSSNTNYDSGVASYLGRLAGAKKYGRFLSDNEKNILQKAAQIVAKTTQYKKAGRSKEIFEELAAKAENGRPFDFFRAWSAAKYDFLSDSEKERINNILTIGCPLTNAIKMGEFTPV